MIYYKPSSYTLMLYHNDVINISQMTSLMYNRSEHKKPPIANEPASAMDNLA